MHFMAFVGSLLHSQQPVYIPTCHMLRPMHCSPDYFARNTNW